jgi:hypothetical protein
MIFGTRARGVVAAIVVILALGLGATASGTTPSLILKVQLVPNAVSPGEQSLAVVTFRNTSRAPQTNVVVHLHFPNIFAGVTPPSSCTPIGGSKLQYACSLGDVGAGQTVHSYVGARVTSKLSSPQSVKVGFSLLVGPGHPKPILTNASGTVLASNDAAHQGGCQKVSHTLTATLAQQVTSLPSPPSADPALQLPCTPLAVAVAPAPSGVGFKTQVSSADVPKLDRPALVKLTFANETLPDEKLIDNVPAGRTPSLDNPNPLWELDGTAPGGRKVVPRCASGPALPSGWDTCIVKVIATDIGNGPSDDFDQGYITLLVQGSGFGDPRWAG